MINDIKMNVVESMYNLNGFSQLMRKINVIILNIIILDISLA